MKRKTGISIILALLMIVSTFAVTPTTAQDDENESIEIVKEVWNGTAWVNEAEGYIGDTFEFRINITYYNITDSDNEHYGENIVVNDTLPGCLEYDVGTAKPFEPVVDDKNLTWDIDSYEGSDFKLYDGESYVITFNATAADLTGIDGEENVANVTVDEHCTGKSYEAEDDATVKIVEEPEPPQPSIDIEKQIWDPCEEEWVDDGATYYICLYKLIEENQSVKFKVNVTNTGNVELNNVIGTDVLPDFLEFPEGGQEKSVTLGSLTPGESFEGEFEARIIPEKLIYDDMLEGENYVNVTGEYEGETYEDEDSVDVTIWKQLSVEKQVYDNEAGEWVNELDHVIKGDTVKFRFVATYHGCEGTIMDCMLAGDLLPNDCLNYTATTKVTVEGEEVYPGTNQYPDVIPDYGNTTTICGNEVEIPDLINCPFTEQGECQVIVWDFRSAEDFDLKDGESVVIEFETEAMQYCDCNFTNIDFAIGWGCYVCDPCNYYADWGWTNVSCEHPPNRFEKTVSLDGENWEENVETFQGDVIHFKLEYEYYSNEMVNYVEIKDQLPCILEYVEGSANIDPTNVSEDLKTIWWNLSGEIPDGEPFVITFDAFVEGYTGTCPECEEVDNQAWIKAWILDECDNPDEVEAVFSEYDTAGIKAGVNNKPCKPFIREDNQKADEEEELTFYVEADDPEEDNIYYQINWGDGTTGWLGPYTAGVEQEFTHSWSTAGTYNIEARAKDEHGKLGEWGNEITVTIEEEEEEEPEAPLTAAINKGFGFNKISATVTNNLENNMTNVDIKGNITYGLISKQNVPINLTGENLSAGANQYNFKVVKGVFKGKMISKISINLTVEAAGYDPVTAEANGMMFLGRLIYIS
ncbi:MAG: PKD domain-containing protein [Candidatus Thermoplasmatota archaeon]